MEPDPMEHLSRNLHLYRRMKDLAAQQETCLSEDRLDLFLQLANQREQLRLQIAANEKKRRSILKDSSERKQGAPAPYLVADIADVIRSIQEIDRKTEEFVFLRREALLSEMGSLRKGRKAVRGYGGRTGTGPPRFIDRKG
ncbi:MAG: flagellar export chaperone FlgN [Thermodesulfobacteriota bacterium]